LRICRREAREVIVELENITQDSQTLWVRDPSELENKLKEILQAVWGSDSSKRSVPAAWADNPELLAAAGQACGELLQLDHAIDCYTKALRMEKAAVPIRCVEQLANLRARRAVIANDKKAAEVISDSIALINSLELLIGPGGGKRRSKNSRRRKGQENGLAERQTMERLSILGSCYKRLAQVTRGDARKAALKQMSIHYYAAFERRRKVRLDTYPLLNWLLAEMLLAAGGAGGTAVDELSDWLAKAEASLTPGDEREVSIWDAMARGDVALARLLLSDADVADRQTAMVEAYLRPWRRGASRLKFASVLENFEFIGAMLDDALSEAAQRLGTALRAAARRLREETRVEIPAPIPDVVIDSTRGLQG